MTEGVHGVDISEENKANIDLAKIGPEYYIVNYGLNVECKCINKKCKAFNNFVIIQVGFIKDYVMCANMKKFTCPMCKSKVSKQDYFRNIFFYKCKYYAKYIIDNPNDDE